MSTACSRHCPWLNILLECHASKGACEVQYLQGAQEGISSLRGKDVGRRAAWLSCLLRADYSQLIRLSCIA